MLILNPLPRPSPGAEGPAREGALPAASCRFLLLAMALRASHVLPAVSSWKQHTPSLSLHSNQEANPPWVYCPGRWAVGDVPCLSVSSAL